MYSKKELVPPVKVGDIIEVEIINIGKKGDGIGKFERFVIVVPGTDRGEIIEVEITRVLENVAFACKLKSD